MPGENPLLKLFSSLTEGSRGVANAGKSGSDDNSLKAKLAQFLDGLVGTNRKSSGNTSELILDTDRFKTHQEYLKYVEEHLLPSDTLYPSSDIYYELQEVYREAHEEARETLTRPDSIEFFGHEFYLLKTDDFPGDDHDKLDAWLERHHPESTTQDRKIYIVQSGSVKYCVIKTSRGILRSFKLDEDDEKIVKDLKIGYLFDDAEVAKKLDTKGHEEHLAKLLFSFKKTVKQNFDPDTVILQPDKYRRNVLNQSVKKLNHKLSRLYRQLNDDTLEEDKRTSILMMLKKDLEALQKRIDTSEQSYIRSQRTTPSSPDAYQEDRLILSILKEMQAEYTLYLEQIEDENHPRKALSNEELKRLNFLNKYSVLWSDYLCNRECYTEAQRRYFANKIVYYALMDADQDRDADEVSIFVDSIEEIGQGPTSHEPYEPIGARENIDEDERSMSGLKRRELAHFLQKKMQLDDVYSEPEHPRLSLLRTDDVMPVTNNTAETEALRTQIQENKQKLQLLIANKNTLEQQRDALSSESHEYKRMHNKLEYAEASIHKLQKEVAEAERQYSKLNSRLNQTFYSADNIRQRCEQLRMEFADRYPVPAHEVVSRENARKLAGMHFINRDSNEQLDELRQETLRQEELTQKLNVLEKERIERLELLKTDTNRHVSIKNIEKIEEAIKSTQDKIEQSRQYARNILAKLSEEETDEPETALPHANAPIPVM